VSFIAGLLDSPILSGLPCWLNSKLGKPQGFPLLLFSQQYKYGTPGGIRTPDLQVRSLSLYPAELRALIDSFMHPNPSGFAFIKWRRERDSNPRSSY
jgi:hypothetical protein